MTNIEDVSQHPERYLCGRLYPVHGLPRPAKIVTRYNPASNSCYPLVEGLLSQQKLQPFVHNCSIAFFERRHVFRYAVFFKKHRQLSRNRFLNATSNGVLRGDVLVMRIGARTPYINFRARDRALSDKIARQYAYQFLLLLDAHCFTRFAQVMRYTAIPRDLCFVKA